MFQDRSYRPRLGAADCFARPTRECPARSGAARGSARALGRLGSFRRRSLRGRRKLPRARRCPDSASCAAEMTSSSLRISAAPSRIQDCPAAGRVALQVYIIRSYREAVSNEPGTWPLPIRPIMYPSCGLEPATSGDLPDIRIVLDIACGRLDIWSNVPLRVHGYLEVVGRGLGRSQSDP